MKTTQKKKSRTYSSIKNYLDRWFSAYIRKRDCKDGYFTCISCGQIKDEKQFNSGHFISRSKLATRWNEQNVHGQCIHCNCFLHGNQYEYGKSIDKKYGKGYAEMLSACGNTPFKYSKWELEILEQQYKEKCNGSNDQTNR